MTAVLVSIISRVITSQQFFLYNSITFISISIASIPVPATHIPTTNIRNNQYTIPTNRPIARIDMNDRVYKTKREKYKAVIEEIEKMVQAGRTLPTI